MSPWKQIIMVLLQLAMLMRSGYCSGDWTYTDPQTSPNKWSHEEPVCATERQSPIEIDDTIAVRTMLLKRVRLFRNPTKNLDGVSYTVKNNGHTVVISFPKDTWYVSFSGREEAQFEAVQMHFHWGSKENQGSEHLYNGRAFELETHVVCFNKKLYSDFSSAATKPDGLAVLAFWNVLTTTSTRTHLSMLGDFVQELPNLVSDQSEVKVDAFSLDEIMDQVNPSAYYRYAGSLTTPPCTPNVIWTIFREPVPISEAELNLLRSIQFGDYEKNQRMQDNYRPVAPLNSNKTLLPRTIYISGSIVGAKSSVISILFAVTFSVSWL